MLTSMTGFCRVSLDREWGNLALEVSSVNSRYLEVFVKAARDLLSEEPFIQAFVKKRLNRGKVQVRADLSWSSNYRMGRINSEALLGYAMQLEAIAGELHLKDGTLPLEALLPLPGVTESPSLSLTVKDSLGETLNEALSVVIDGLISMRETEGKEIYGDIDSHLRQYESVVGDIGSKWRNCADEAFLALKDRVTAAAERFSCSLDEGRLAQELTIIADKWDISEEIARTGGHLGQFRLIMDGKGPNGRKLDFLLQEMNRELNTMGSKVSDAEIRWLVVEGKTILERIREQIQNVE